jgi:hypothetical protein
MAGPKIFLARQATASPADDPQARKEARQELPQHPPSPRHLHDSALRTYQAYTAKHNL